MKKIFLLLAVALCFSCGREIQDKETELDLFVKQVLTTFKNSDYGAYEDLYISKSEIRRMYATYGYGSDFAEMKYKKIVSIMPEDRFKTRSEKAIFNCIDEFQISPRDSIRYGKLSEAFGEPIPTEEEDEYYFIEEFFVAKCTYQFSPGAVTKEVKSNFKLGEAVFIPGKGWKLFNGPRF